MDVLCSSSGRWDLPTLMMGVADFSETSYMSCSVHRVTSETELIHIYSVIGMETSAVTEKAPLLCILMVLDCLVLENEPNMLCSKLLVTNQHVMEHPRTAKTSSATLEAGSLICFALHIVDDVRASSNRHDITYFLHRCNFPDLNYGSLYP
jgi:hypothetical protein